MGHHHEQHSVYKERELLVIQKHTVSFLLVFSVAAVALVVLIASVQTKASTCQTRAGVGIYTLQARLDEDGNYSLLVETIHAGLQLKGVHAEPLERGFSCEERRIDLFDTVEKTLVNSGFRLLREVCGNNVVWQLRYLDQSLCHTNRKISMGALPNDDYEKVSYVVKAVHAEGVRSFLYQVNVETKNRKRITMFSQLQSLFPGFNSQVASPEIILSKSLKVETVFSSELYHRSKSIDIEVKIEKVTIENYNRSFWSVVVSSGSIYAEENLQEVHRMISKEMQRRNILCDMARCGDAFTDDFVQY